MQKVVVGILIPIFFVLYAHAQTRFSVMFYNTENLFDYFDDTTKVDNEFLPLGKKHWTKEKFDDKISKLTKVITAVGKTHAPDLVGLCEVENKFCLTTLTEKSNLSRLNYKYIHFESGDKRGIDVALLYREKFFTPIKSTPVKIVFEDNRRIKTRDILYVKGYSKNLADTVHVFVNHWPSRMGGKAKSEVRRNFVAKTLRQKTDSILRVSKQANIIIIGDFNDEQTDESIAKILGAANADTCKNSTSNLFRLIPKTGNGTHKYRGHWAHLDHMIVSGNLKNIYKPTGYISDEQFLQLPDPKNFGTQPFRTYQGPKYLGGFSDHMPVYFEIVQ